MGWGRIRGWWRWVGGNRKPDRLSPPPDQTALACSWTWAHSQQGLRLRFHLSSSHDLGLARGRSLGLLSLAIGVGGVLGLAGLGSAAELELEAAPKPALEPASAAPPPTELVFEPVERSEPDRVVLRWTPESGWQGEYQLRLAAGISGAQQKAQGYHRRWALDLGVIAKAHPFVVEAGGFSASPGLGDSLSLHPVSIQLQTYGPFWTGGPELEGTLGDFRMDWSSEFGGDARRNRVRGVHLKTGSGTVWAGWPGDSVPPLRHTKEQPGADHRLWGWRWEWQTPRLKQEGNSGVASVCGLRFEAGGRSGTAAPPRASLQPASYREDVAGVAVWAERGSWRWKAQAGAQQRQWGTGCSEPPDHVQRSYEVDGVGWVQLRKDERGARGRVASWQVDAYAVSAGFHPWAAQRAKANPLYGWRGERAVQVGRVAWLDLPLPRPVGSGSWRLEGRLALGDRAGVIPELAELGLAPAWRSAESAGAGRSAGLAGADDRQLFVRGGWEARGPVGRWLNVTGSGAWQSVSSGRRSSLPALSDLSVTAWGRLELAKALTIQLGSLGLRCQPSYKISWQSATPSESSDQGDPWDGREGGASSDGDPWGGSDGDWLGSSKGDSQGGVRGDALGNGEDDPQDGSEGDGQGSNEGAPGEAGAVHQLVIRMGWGAPGAKQPALATTLAVSCDRSRPPIWELSAAWDSPNGWQWRLKRTWPDESARQSDSYLLVRQNFPW